MEDLKVKIGEYSRPYLGERVNGDSLWVNYFGDKMIMMVIDGIGHGQRAFEISRKLLNFYKRSNESRPSKLIEIGHQHMAGTEGCVAGIAMVDKKKAMLTYAGLGNISCKIYGEKSKLMISSDGLLGVRWRTAKDYHCKLSDRDIIMLSSDGVSTRITNKELSQLRYKTANSLAKHIVHTWGSKWDDSTCIIGKVYNES